MNARATRRPRGGAGRGPRISKGGGRGGKSGGGSSSGCVVFLLAVAAVPSGLWWLVTR